MGKKGGVYALTSLITTRWGGDPFLSQHKKKREKKVCSTLTYERRIVKKSLIMRLKKDRLLGESSTGKRTQLIEGKDRCLSLSIGRKQEESWFWNAERRNSSWWE